MAIQFLNAVDVTGEVQGTSLDINGNADISGNLGVGTSSPGASLHVASTTTDYVAKFSHSTATGYAPGSILLQAGQSDSRGQGLFHYNTEADDSWFTGVPYNVTSTKWVVAHKADTTFNPDVAQTSHAILTIDSSDDSATFAGNVTLSGIILDGNTITGVDDSGEFTDNDAHIMTSAGINDRFAQINADTTGSSGSCTGNAATATLATDATNLNATDDRDMAPEDYGFTNDFRVFFTSKEGLEDGTSTGSNWMDAIYINSYSDASGHDANVLAFDKSTKAIYHYQADQAATNWGTAKQLAYTDSDISGDTTGTAAIATTITVADESSDTSCNVLFATAATGNLAPKSGTNLTFNSSSGVLTATSFAGALTGNVTGNCSGTAATVTGAAQTNITSLGTLSSVTVSGNINANGNIVGDDGTSITNIDNIQLDNVMADADTTTRIGLGSTSMEFLVADSDVMDLNETTLNVSGILVAKKHKLAKTSNTDGNADGDIVYFGATTSMDTGKIYYLNSSGNWALADADAESTAKGMLGVALGAASDTNGVLIRGMVTLDTDPGTIGDTLFLSTTAGVATSTAPSGNGDIVRVIGYCLDSTNGQIYFNPDGTFVEVTA